MLLIASLLLYNNHNKEVQILNSPPEISENTENVIEDSSKPVIYGLGVWIDEYKEETGAAGDILFDNDLVYDDGRVSGNKPFIDFGSKEKYFENRIGNIEYWFYVPLETKVKSPIDGRIEIVYFDHTKDYGVNIYPENSEYIISFEHLENLKVKSGDVVSTGHILGDAASRSTFNDEIAMTELAIWKGGERITKFCPFDFLDESIKSLYSEKINKLALDWENFIGENVYEQEKWVSPGCLVKEIIEN